MLIGIAEHMICKMAERSVRSVSWTPELTDQLIDLYEVYPCLYNTKDKDYHYRNKKSKAFAEIATTLEMTGTCMCIHNGKCMPY